MKTIYKYHIPILSEFQLRLPKDAVILAFQTQNGTPTIWAIIDTSSVEEERSFMLFGTGHPVPAEANLQYIGTTQQGLDPLSLVWHLFEKVK